MQRDDEQMLKVIMFQCQPLQLLNRPNATPSALSHLMITVKSTTPTLVTKETLSNHRRFWPAAYQFTSSVRKLFFHSSTIRKLGWRRDRKVTDATRWKAQTIGRGGGRPMIGRNVTLKDSQAEDENNRVQSGVRFITGVFFRQMLEVDISGGSGGGQTFNFCH